MMHTATTVGTSRRKSQTYRFRSLDALARRLAGRSARWKVEHDPAYAAPVRTVAILRPTSHGARVITRLRIARTSLVSSLDTLTNP